MTTKYKPILCLDFDGVIHRYDTKWSGPEFIPDPPVKGAFEAIENYMEHFKVCIFSSRSQSPMGIDSMKQWFRFHGFDRVDELNFPTDKPPAFITIDDRAWCFNGTWPTVNILKNFKPWNKK